MGLRPPAAAAVVAAVAALVLAAAVAIRPATTLSSLHWTSREMLQQAVEGALLPVLVKLPAMALATTLAPEHLRPCGIRRHQTLQQIVLHELLGS